MVDYTLHTYFRSSCSARLRIALNLKGVSYDVLPVNLLKNEQWSESHASLNPSASVPVLCHHALGGTIRVEQSVAAMEYLDELHPERPLLPPPSNLAARARVRVLVNIISTDIQPVTNLRILRLVRDIGGDGDSWSRGLIQRGLQAYEAIIKGSAGRYSVGNEITMADVCLVPAVWGAERYGVDMTQFPTISGVFDVLDEHPSFVAAHWRKQMDTPQELRVE